MKPYTLDTNIVSALLKGNEKVKGRFQQELRMEKSITLNAISWYEIKRGLLKIRSINKTTLFEELFSQEDILPLDYQSLLTSSQIYANLSNRGIILEDADILIAGMSIAHKTTLVTGNLKHFQRIEGLKLENWL